MFNLFISNKNLAEQISEHIYRYIYFCWNMQSAYLHKNVICPQDILLTVVILLSTNWLLVI